MDVQLLLVYCIDQSRHSPVVLPPVIKTPSCGIRRHCLCAVATNEDPSCGIYSQVPGQYGELRVGNYSNVPGSRIGAATWTDNGAGLVYMFGGHCIDEQANISMRVGCWQSCIDE